MNQLSPRRLYAHLFALLLLALVASLAWARGEHVEEDRGSDSTEKALMIVLGATLAGSVAVAGGVFVARKIGALTSL